jgi:type IV pilus assembly protein PilA
LLLKTLAKNDRLCSPRSEAAAGFTLVELLLALAGVLVLMTIVVPALEHANRRADEADAVESLRTLNQMEGQYAANYPEHGFACSRAELGGKPSDGPPTPEAAQLVDADLARGIKSGYRFAVSGCTEAARDGHQVATGYVIDAVPLQPGKTGIRGFCTSQDARLAADPAGGTNCTVPLEGQ